MRAACGAAKRLAAAFMRRILFEKKYIFFLDKGRL
jgi:hypothetical protein